MKISHLIKIVAGLWIAFPTTFLLAAEETPPLVKYLHGNSGDESFPGAAENGWLEEWKALWPRHPNGLEGHFTAEVVQTNPFSDDCPQRLEIRKIGEQKMIALSRMMDPQAVDTSKPYVVGFKVRLSSEGSSLSISGHREESDGGPTGSSWFVISQNGRWWVVGQKESGGQDKETLRWEQLSMRAEPGVVYSFLVQVNPEAGSYQVQISDEADQVNSPEMLSANPQATSGEANQLIFRCSTKDDEEDLYSLADIEVRAVK